MRVFLLLAAAVCAWAQSFAGSSALDALAEEAIRDGLIPGGVLLVSHNGQVVHRKAYGSRALVPEREAATLDTIYDAASLTKVLVTTPSIMKLLEQGKMDIALVAGEPAYEAFAGIGRAPTNLKIISAIYSNPGMFAVRGDSPAKQLRDLIGKPIAWGTRASGLTLLGDVPGSGAPVRRQHHYRIRLRLWLNQGQAVRWQMAWGPVGIARLEDDGATLITEVRIDRRSLVNGLFYGVEGMHVGGMRRLKIAPRLAYGERGVPGIVPPNAVITAEITVLEQCDSNRSP